MNKAAHAEHAKHLADRSKGLIHRWKELTSSRDSLSEDMDTLITDIRNFAAYTPDEDLDESLVNLANSLQDIAKSMSES